MPTPQQLFQEIGEQLISKNEHVDFGTMMSSPGIQYKGKNFFFLWSERASFRVGKSFDADEFGLKNWNYLDPFKKKPPMKGWIVVGIDQAKHWPDLAKIALKKIQSPLAS